MSTHDVDITLLTMSVVLELSTISLFGAKLISLYLFPSKKRGNLMKNLIITMLITTKRGRRGQLMWNCG